MKNICLVLISTTVLFGCANIFDELASKDSEAAILYEARRLLQKSDWDGAIAEFDKLTSETLADTEVLVQRASAYSGKCGLNFINISDGIQNAGGATNFFQILISAIRTTDIADFAHCKTSETMLKTVADATTGIVNNSTGQFLMAFNSIAKISAILSARSDSDNDGAADVGWDPCHAANGNTDLPAAEVAEIGTGITLFINNIAGLAVGSSEGSDLGELCDDGLPANDFCSVIDTSGITSDMRHLIRSLIRETDDGQGLKVSPGGAAAQLPACSACPGC